MRKVTIYCEGGTTWTFKTTDDDCINNLRDWLDNPKAKDLMAVNDNQNKRKIYMRKQKVNMMIVDEVAE